MRLKLYYGEDTIDLVFDHHLKWGLMFESSLEAYESIQLMSRLTILKGIFTAGLMTMPSGRQGPAGKFRRNLQVALETSEVSHQKSILSLNHDDLLSSLLLYLSSPVNLRYIFT